MTTNLVIRSSAILPSGAILLSAIFWGTSWIPLRAMHEEGWPGTWIAFLIYGVPVVLLLPILFGKRRSQLFTHWRKLALIGFFTSLCNMLFAIGVSYGDVALVILLFYLNPVWSVFLERIILKVPITVGRGSAIGLGLIGMWVLLAAEGNAIMAIRGAEGLGLIAGFSWSLSLVAIHRSQGIHPFHKTFAQYFFGAILGIFFVAYSFLTDPIDLGAMHWGQSLGWSVLINGGWVLPALLLAFWGAARLSPTNASMLFLMEAVVGVGSAALLGESTLTMHHSLGGALILAAGLLDGWQEKMASKKKRA